jgi:hypothetical protein
MKFIVIRKEIFWDLSEVETIKAVKTLNSLNSLNQ